MGKSLSTKLFYSIMIVTIVVVVGVTVVTSYLLTDYFHKSKTDSLLENGEQLADTVNYFLDKKLPQEDFRRYLLSIDNMLDARIWVFDDKYNLVAASSINTTNNKQEDNNPASITDENLDLDKINADLNNLAAELKNTKFGIRARNILQDVYNGKSVTTQIYHNYYQEQVILVGIPYGYHDGDYNAHGGILLASPLSGFLGIFKTIYTYMFLVGVLALLLNLLVAKQLSKKIVEPLIVMKDTTVALAAGDYSKKVDVKGEDEVAELGKAINNLSTDLSIYIDKLSRIDKMRKDFVANVSHELKTPITIIRGYADVMEDNIDDAKSDKRYCGLIIEETNRLERLVKRLLEISRLQAADDIDIATSEVLPISDMIKNICNSLQIKANTKDITINSKITEGISLIGNGDMIVQLLIIFGDNAIKYSPEKTTVEYESYLNEDGSFTIAIEDHGFGISEEEIPFIFERFYKIDKSHNRSIEGNGIGLAIAKEILRVHNAQVEVFSKVDKGTTFKITFLKTNVVINNQQEG